MVFLFQNGHARIYFIFCSVFLVSARWLRIFADPKFRPNFLISEARLNDVKLELFHPDKGQEKVPFFRVKVTEPEADLELFSRLFFLGSNFVAAPASGFGLMRDVCKVNSFEHATPKIYWESFFANLRITR